MRLFLGSTTGLTVDPIRRQLGFYDSARVSGTSKQSGCRSSTPDVDSCIVLGFGAGRQPRLGDRIGMGYDLVDPKRPVFVRRSWESIAGAGRLWI